MLEMLQLLVGEVNMRGHLNSLINGVKLKVLLNCENEAALLKIEKGKLEIIDLENQSCDAIISGNKPIITDLLAGRIKLRNANKRKMIELKSTIRASLLLESLFYLATSKNQG